MALIWFIYISIIVIYQEVLSELISHWDIRHAMSEALLALEGDRGPKLKELLLQPFGRSLAAGFSRQTLGISPTKMGIMVV